MLLGIQALDAAPQDVPGMMAGKRAVVRFMDGGHVDPEGLQRAPRFSAPAAGPGWRATTMHPGLTGTSDPECYELVVGALGPETP